VLTSRAIEEVGRERHEEAKNEELLSALAGKGPAQVLMEQYGELTPLAQASFEELQQVKGVGRLLVDPRGVFLAAVARRSAAIVLVHNHPSGDPTPSEADIKVTRDLIRAGQVLKIEVVDHVILGQRTTERPVDWVSLRQLGFFSS